jgi:hypothetical protein
LVLAALVAAAQVEVLISLPQMAHQILAVAVAVVVLALKGQTVALES